MPGPRRKKEARRSGRAESKNIMNIVSLNQEPQSPAPQADAPDLGAPPKKRRRTTGEQVRRLVRQEFDRRDPITVARALLENHPELAVSSFRWLVRQVAWALALEQLRDVGVTPHR